MRQRVPASYRAEPDTRGRAFTCIAGERALALAVVAIRGVAAENAQRPVNDDSCVIRIDDGSHSLLLTGDAEKGGGAAARLRRDRLTARGGGWGTMAAKLPAPPFARG
ncbi:hypothetical protein M8494_16375 [Serratia ureilytica]